MRKIYLDVCCLNRPFDDQSQDRIRLEAEAVLLILSHLEAREWQWIGSEVIDAEVFLTTDDKLLQVARRSSEKLQILVSNPLDWLKGVNE